MVTAMIGRLTFRSHVLNMNSSRLYRTVYAERVDPRMIESHDSGWINKRLLMRQGDNKRDLVSETMAIFRNMQGRMINKFAVNGGKLFR